MPSQDNFFKVKTGLGVGTDTLYASVEDTKVTIGATTGNYELNVIGTIYSDYDVLVDNNVGIGTTLPFQRLDVRGIGIFSGSVGIGTTLPVQIFQVNGIGTQSVVVTGLGSFGIGTLDPYHPFQYVGVGNSNLVVITGIGSVGIGTSLPNFDVDLFGDARVTGFATITNAFIGVATVGFATITNEFVGISTIGFATITNAFIGVATVGFATITNEFVGISTIGFATITDAFIGVATVGFATITDAFIGVATVGFATITDAFIGVATVGFATITDAFIGVATVGFATITNEFVGISTIGFATITNEFVGISTIGFATITNEFVGISTINQLLVTGITTTAELDVGIGATLSIFGNFQITPVTDLNDNLIKNIQPIVGINTIYPTRTLDVAGDLRVRGEVIDSGNNVGFAYSVLSSNGNNIPGRFSDAANLLLRNKNFIASEIVGFITSTQGPFGANGPLFDYGTAGVLVGRNKCKRDIKSIIDSIAFDISKGGNSKVVAAGLSYYTGNTLSYLDDTDPLPPGFAPNYVKTGALAGISSISHFAKYVINNAVPPTSYQFGNNYHRNADASNLIKANKALIAEVAVARMLAEYSEFIVPNGNQHCVDDIIKVLEAVAYNVQFGYNDKVWDAAQLYVSNSYLDGEETESVYAFNQARDMAIQAMRNETITITGSSRVQVKDLSITVDLDSPTCANVASAITTLFSIVTQAIIVGHISFFVGDIFSDASNLIKANKALIAEVAVDRMLTEYSGFTVPNGNQHCVDDIIKVLEAVAYNVQFGYNDKVWDAANLYVTGAHVVGEENQSIYAFNQAKDMAIQAMRNETITITGSSRVQVKDATITVDSSSPTCANVASAITTLFSIVTGAIDSGVIGSSVGDRFADASNLIKSNKALIAEVAVDRMLTEYSGFTVPNGNQHCVDDIIKVLDAVAHNLRFGYNDKVWDAAQLYVGNPYLAGEENQSIYAFNQAKDMAIQAMRNQTITITGSSGVQVKDTTITVDLDSPTCANVESAITTLFSIVTGAIDSGVIGSSVGDRFADASNLIKSNKALIAEVAVDRMLTEYSGFTVPNGNQHCVDDIIKVLDAVAHNLRFGYNDKVWDAANLYVTGAHVVGEENQSVYAFNQAKDMAIQAMRNETITITGSSRVQVKDATITVDSSSPTCANVASAIATLNSIVTQAISTGSISNIPRTLSDITPRTLSDITPRTSLARTSAEFDSQLFDFNVLPDGGSNTSPNGCSNVVSAIYTCVGIVTSIVDGGISAAPPINNPIGNLVWNPPGAKIGNEWFVNKLGSDENYGRSPGDSFLTIKKACSVAQPGDTVRVYTGLYVEDGPIQVPERVAVVGEDLRRTLVSTRDKTDLYYVKRGCYIAQQSFVGPSNPGKAMVSFPVQGFGFANGTEQNWQSPYIQNCTNFVPDSIGLRIDGARAGGFKSMVLDAFTQYNQGGIGVSITNFGYAQLVSLFTICCDIAVFCDSGGVCDLNNSNVSFGNFGLVSDGATPLQYTGTVIEAPDGDNVDGLIISVGIGASQEFIDSASLMILNKDFIAAEAVGFMTSTDGPFGIGATYFDYGGSSLGKSICIRDSKIIVESLVADLLNLGNLNSINAGLAYRDSSDGSLTYLPETSPPPGTLSYGYIKTAELALIDHIAGISTYIIQNINIPDTYQVGSPVADRNADASNLIKANKELIAEVAVGRMLNNYSEFIVPNGNQNCVDDIIKVLDAVAHNLKFGYNDKVWDAAQLYVSNSYLDGEETESIYAFNQARDMAIQAMRNETIDIDVYSSRVQVKDTTITVDPNSPTCTNLEVTITTLFSIITEVISLGSIITIDRSSGAGVLYQVKDLSKLYSPLANTFISSRAGIITSIIGIGVAAVPEKILPKGQRPYDGQIAYIDTQYYFVKEIIIDNPGSGYNPDIPVNVLVDFPPNPDYFIPAEAAIFETDVNFDGTISNISVLVSGTGYNEIPPTITIDAPVSGVRATGIAVMEKYFFNPLSSTPISVGSPVADRNADASNLIKANKELIAEVAVGRMLNEYSGFTVPNGNQNCVDDIIKVLDAVAHNLKFGYNDKVWDAAQLYISGAHVAGEETESVYAFNQARDMAIQAMRNETIDIDVYSSRVQVKDTTITVDPTPTCTDVASAITILTSIVTQAISTGSISDINRTYSDSGGITTVTFDQFITYSPLIGVGSTVYFFQSSKIIASGITFEFVGCGINIVDSIPSKGAVPIVENQIVPSNGGKVPFTSTDQGGNFRISEGITINQNTGTITGQAFSKSLQAEVTPLIIALQR